MGLSCYFLERPKMGECQLWPNTVRRRCDGLFFLPVLWSERRFLESSSTMDYVVSTGSKVRSITLLGGQLVLTENL